MGETVSFKSNGNEANGYLATPSSGRGPGLLVLQEWWGLSPELKMMCDRLAGEGFVALAPDLYHGELAGHTEMDKAAQLMNALPPDRAARDMSGAVAYLLGHDAVTGDSVGAIGFCMGGMLAFLVAAREGDKVGAVVPYYGFPQGDAEPDWSGLTAPVLGHMAENDDFFPPVAIEALAEKLRGMGKDVTVHVYPGTGHAFASGHNALGTANEEAGALAWSRSMDFLKAKLGS
jgi:carboxymethylenebutenolidase